MNKNIIKSLAAFALIGGAPLLQAQVLGGGATGGLGGNLGGTLGNGMGSIGGSGQGSMGGTLGGTFDHGDTLRRHTTGAVDRTRETGGRVRDRASGTRDVITGTGSSAASSAQGQVSGAASGAANAASNGIAGSSNAAGNAAGSVQKPAYGAPSAPALPDVSPPSAKGDGKASADGGVAGSLTKPEPTTSNATQPQGFSSPVRASANANANANGDASVSTSQP
jgi:hypothetical protein